MTTHVSSLPAASTSARDFAFDGARYQPLVGRIAMKLVRRLPSSVDAAELVNVGWVGLLEAASRAPANMNGDEFEHFASCRVKGAMMDHLRSLSPNARERRNSARRIAMATKRAEREHGRAPKEQEIAAQMGKSVEAYRAEVEAGSARSFHTVDIDETEIAGNGAAADESVEKKQLVEALASAVATLAPRSQQILSLYFREECTLREIGAILGVTESRVSQLVSEATRALKKHFEAN
jgi:RNA polymerase sigma factor FliA